MKLVKVSLKFCIIVTIILLPIFFFTIPSYAYIETANPNASDEAKKILNWINELLYQQADPVTGEVNRVILGQSLAYQPQLAQRGYENLVEDLANQPGSNWVAMVGTNYGWGSSPEEIHLGNLVLVNYWNDGGLITLHHHADSPFISPDEENNCSIEECPCGSAYAGSPNDTRYRNHEELLNPTNEFYRQAHDRWEAELEKIADGFEELQQAGVVVLWRPFQEMNWRKCFWWDSGAHGDPFPGDPEPFKAMWIDMFDYFSKPVEEGGRGLNNLLWVYAPAQTDDWSPRTSYYAGDEYVDIVAPSSYGCPPLIRGSTYPELSGLGKTFGISEAGSTSGSCNTELIIDRVESQYPLSTYLHFWHGDWAIINNQNASGLMSHPWIITREEVDWQSYVLPDEGISIIIDNDDIDPAENKWFTTNHINPDDTWQKWESSSGQHLYGSHFYNRLLGDGDTASWHFILDDPGTYKVYAWWPDYDFRPTDVPYTINYADGSDVVQVNQQESGSQWNLLGSYRFESGLEYTVVVSDEATPGITLDDVAYKDVVADAIKIEYFRQCFGDNSTIDSDDVEAWSQDYFAIDSSLDINSDSKINSFEFSHLLSNWGEDCES